MSATQVGMDTPLQPPPPVPEGPGARLRAAREGAGLSLDQVAQQLKLAPRQVRALEEEDFAQLPGRTFARGFVRNYARLVHLDGDDLLAQLPDAAQAPALAAPALHATGSTMAEVPAAHAARSLFARWLIPLVLVVCLFTAGAYEWYRNGFNMPAETLKIEQASPPVAVPAAPGSPAGTARSELPIPLAGAALEPPSTPSAEGAATAMPGSSAPETSTPSQLAETPAPLVLSYRAPSWTEVRDRDGQVLIARLVAAGSEQAIRGSAPFELVIGNAQNVTVTYQGKTVDLSRYTRQNVARLRLLP
jgi:cytoskeleton protein RodZ